MTIAAPGDADWAQLVDRLRSSDRVLCIAHVSPDGDALGSAMAVALALEALGVEALVTFDEEPFGLPTTLRWLPRQDLLIEPARIPSARVDSAVSFDASDIDRLGRVGSYASDMEFFAAIDHHRSHQRFAALAIVDVDAPATAVLALRLVDKLGVALTADIASCLYVGLTTDTGSFRFAGTTAETHRMAARLHDAGIAHSEIAREVFDTRPFGALKLLGMAVARADLVKVTPTVSMVTAWIDLADRAQWGLGLDAAEAIIDTLRTVDVAEVAVLLKQADDGTWRISMRSKGIIDVSVVCTALGGGGHRFAAGFSSDREPTEIFADVATQIERQCQASS